MNTAKKNFFWVLMTLTSVQWTSYASVSQINLTPYQLKNDQEGFSGSIGYLSNQLVEDVGDVVGNQYSADTQFQYTSSKNTPLAKHFKMATRTNSANQTMFSVEEAFAQYNFENSSLKFGRQILDWSQVDRHWSLGKLNNRRNFDGFEPGEEGLTGISYRKKSSSGWAFDVFLSMIYVPELNPGVEINDSNGTVTCNNAWSVCPSKTAMISESTERNIFYNVNMPDISDVVFRYSAGFNFGYEANAYSIKGFAMKKPENQISVIAEAKYVRVDEQVFADITPQVYYHNIFGGEVRLKPTNNIDIYASYINVTPDQFPDGNTPYIEYLKIKPEKINEDYGSTGVTFSNDFFNAGLHYIARLSSFEVEEETLTEFPRWNQAVNVNLLTRVTKMLSLGLDYKVDTLTNDRLTMLRANYQVNPSFVTSLGANIIGSSSDDSYWASFANNDSLFGSVRYVF